MIEIGRRGAKGSIARCTGCILCIGRNPRTMRANVMNHYVGLGVSRMFTRRTLVLHGCILIGVLFRWMGILRMIGSKVMKKRRSLQELRLVHTLFAFMGEILLVITSDMIMHRILLLLHHLAIRADKLPLRISLILLRKDIH